jgi:hypothetical protein
MDSSYVDEAVTQLEKANADLEPELLSADATRSQLATYARAEKLAAYGKTVLATKLDDPAALARTSGVSVGKAKTTVDTGNALAHSDEVRDAFKGGAISSDQASEIAKAEQARPGAASELLAVASNEAFQVLREKARKVVLEAEQHRGLAARQHEARSARSYADELGMVHLHVAWEPHVGTPIVNRAEVEAARLYRQAKKEGCEEPFERHLADAYAALLAGEGKGHSRRPELVVLVSYEVAKRGWTEVKVGEHCQIPGVGPVSPQVAKEIAADAFLNGVFFDGKDLRHFQRWTGSDASIVETAFGPRMITSSPMSRSAPRRSATSSLAVGLVTRPRQSAIARRASSSPPIPDLPHRSVKWDPPQGIARRPNQARPWGLGGLDKSDAGAWKRGNPLSGKEVMRGPRLGSVRACHRRDSPSVLISDHTRRAPAATPMSRMMGNTKLSDKKRRTAAMTASTASRPRAIRRSLLSLASSFITES